MDKAFSNDPFLTTDQLQVKFNQNFLGFEFSAFEYRNSERIRYKYRLEGVDEDWVRAMTGTQSTTRI